MKKDKKPQDILPERTEDGIDHPFGLTEAEAKDLGRKTFKYWFKNVFWYHYGKITIAAVLGVIVLTFLTVDFLTSKETAFVYLVASPLDTSDMLLLDLSHDFLETLVDEKAINYEWMTRNGNKDWVAQYVKGMAFAIGESSESSSADRQRLDLYVMDADYVCCFISKKIGYIWKERGQFLDLSEHGFETVEGKPWLVDISDTKWAKNFAYPEDEFYAAVLKTSDAKAKKNREKHEMAFKLISFILADEIEE